MWGVSGGVWGKPVSRKEAQLQLGVQGGGGGFQPGGGAGVLSEQVEREEENSKK